MDPGLLDAFRHSAWATRNLIEFCSRLNEDQLRACGTGSFGSILETLQHMIGSESFYRFLFTGNFFEWDWADNELPTLTQLQSWTGDLAAFWETLLAEPIDGDRILRQTTPANVVREERAGVVLAQALHHANIHREQVAMLLTSLGIEPPDLDVWVYSSETGRSPGS